MTFLTFVGLLTVFLVGSGAGLWLGYALGLQHGEATREDLLRLLETTNPTPRAPGTPTNMEGPPARQTSARYRQRRRWDLQG